MNRKLLAGIVEIALIIGFIRFIMEKDEEGKHQCFSVVQIGTEVISAYRNGVDFTEKYKTLEQKAKNEAAKYLQKDISEVKFDNYSILEMIGMTIEAAVGDICYTFLFNMDGKILKVNCSEENKLEW